MLAGILTKSAQSEIPVHHRLMPLASAGIRNRTDPTHATQYLARGYREACVGCLGTRMSGRIGAGINL